MLLIIVALTTIVLGVLRASFRRHQLDDAPVCAIHRLDVRTAHASSDRLQDRGAFLIRHRQSVATDGE
jgi:hypothetical protein